MKTLLKRTKLQGGDEAWLVIDKDSWEDPQLQPLKRWEQKSTRHGVAMSLPQFEAWLLQHFEEVRGAMSKSDCKKLSKYLPDYNKGIDPRKITEEQIQSAIRREETRYQQLYPHEEAPFHSVDELIKRLMQST